MVVHLDPIWWKWCEPMRWNGWNRILLVKKWKSSRLIRKTRRWLLLTTTPTRIFVRMRPWNCIRKHTATMPIRSIRNAVSIHRWPTTIRRKAARNHCINNRYWCASINSNSCKIIRIEAPTIHHSAIMRPIMAIWPVKRSPLVPVAQRRTFICFRRNKRRVHPQPINHRHRAMHPVDMCAFFVKRPVQSHRCWRNICERIPMNDRFPVNYAASPSKRGAIWRNIFGKPGNPLFGCVE